MSRNLLIVLLVASVTALPFLLRRTEDAPPARADDRLVIVTPHTEAIRKEFGVAFRDWYRQKTGRSVEIDWRMPGGTSEIVRYLNGQFADAFRDYWTGPLGRSWSGSVHAAFNDPKVEPATTDDATDEPRLARRAFLDSRVSIGIDVFFGGGSFDHARLADRGLLVPSRVVQAHPEWFTQDVFPQSFGGENLRDPKGRWFGAAISSFGLVYNRDALRRCGVDAQPASWADLADPRLRGAVAVADPTKSGSVAKAFEMILQQQMQIALAEAQGRGLLDKAREGEVVSEGWMRGLRLVQKIAANGRYFTDAASKPVLDVAAGDCAAGMAIDFYGRIQEQTLSRRNPAGAGRFAYVTPKGGSSLSADPIAILRGAPHPAVAEAFVEFVLSLEGQKLWMFNPGAPGGPHEVALGRQAVRRELYGPEFATFRTYPRSDPYRDVEGFEYRASLTGRVFNELRLIVKIACIDPHEELRAAWTAILRARKEGRHTAADHALAEMENLDVFRYSAVTGELRSELQAGPLSRLAVEDRLGRHFRAQYVRAAAIANGEPSSR